MTLALFLAAQTAYQAASARTSTRRGELARELNLSLSDAQKHHDYVALSDESLRLYRKVEALTMWPIRANLEAFGLEDLPVTGTLMGTDRTTRLGSVDLSLSELCCLRYSGVADKLGHRHGDVDLSLIVEKEGVRIGRVGSDGDFDYEAAPDLRTALGWKLATDGGRVGLVRIDLDAETEAILDVVKTNGTDEEVFFGKFEAVVKGVFEYENGSRFADGYCGAQTILWQVATRQLGDEHEGYPFMF
jgi:hypothetical protein